MNLTPQHVVRNAQFFHTDAVTLLKNVKEAALIFADPPFNIGVQYENWTDSMTREQYLKFTADWMSAAGAGLQNTGSLWINIPDEWAAECVVIGKRLGFKLENWCIWHFRFGVCQPSRFIKSKTHALWFSLGSPRVIREAALVPSDRAALYDDPRSPTGLRMDLDVWGFDKFWGRVTGTSAERRPLHPNQLPEKYLQRIVGVCSLPGELVVDPFCGSGTTATVAEKMDRRVVTGDVSLDYLKSASERCASGPVRL
jgi:DNA modification methylase